MKWPVTVTATTHTANGCRVTMRRTVEGAGNVERAMLGALRARRDAGIPFHGEEIVAVTPVGQRVRRIFQHDDSLTVVTSKG